MTDVFICDGIRTPVGRYGGSLSSIRADDLGAIPIKALMERNPSVDWANLDDVLLGCANQSGEDNRNVARMSSLLAGIPLEAPGCTINRLLNISRYYVSPGGTTECCNLFCGIIDSTGIGGIHGLPEENEDIRVFVVDAAEAYQWVAEGKIKSSATVISLLWLQLNEARLIAENDS